MKMFCSIIIFQQFYLYQSIIPFNFENIFYLECYQYEH